MRAPPACGPGVTADPLRMAGRRRGPRPQDAARSRLHSSSQVSPSVIASSDAVTSVTITSVTKNQPAPQSASAPTPARESWSRRAETGRALLVVAAVTTTVPPVLLDAVVFADEHMQNPAWPPHAKFHAAIL